MRGFFPNHNNFDIDLGYFKRAHSFNHNIILSFTDFCTIKMRWTVNLEGGPKRVNHAACAIGDKIYSVGGYCSGEVRSRLAPIDVFGLDTSQLKV